MRKSGIIKRGSRSSRIQKLDVTAEHSAMKGFIGMFSITDGQKIRANVDHIGCGFTTVPRWLMLVEIVMRILQF